MTDKNLSKRSSSRAMCRKAGGKVTGARGPAESKRKVIFRSSAHACLPSGSKMFLSCSICLLETHVRLLIILTPFCVIQRESLEATAPVKASPANKRRASARSAGKPNYTEVSDEEGSQRADDGPESANDSDYSSSR